MYSISWNRAEGHVRVASLISLFFAVAAPVLVRADAGRGEGIAPANAGEAQATISPEAEALQTFDQWSAQQDFYSGQLLVEMRVRLRSAFSSMPPGEAAQFRDEFLLKVNILSDPQWQKAEQWLVETLAVASDSYAKKLLTMMPDVVADRPSELRGKLRAIAIRESNLKQAQKAFDEIRQTALQTAREEDRRQTQFNAQLRASMTYSTPNLYSPTVRTGPAPAQRYSDYFNRRYASPFYFPLGGVWIF